MSEQERDAPVVAALEARAVVIPTTTDYYAWVSWLPHAGTPWLGMAHPSIEKAMEARRYVTEPARLVKITVPHSIFGDRP